MANNWDVWISATGDPLPRKATAEFSENKCLRRIEVVFKDWNLSPQVASDRFSPTVLPDYEGGAILQRARVLRNMPKDDESGALDWRSEEVNGEEPVMCFKTMTACGLLLTTAVWLAPVDAQVRAHRRGAVVRGEEGRAAAVGPRGVAVKRTISGSDWISGRGADLTPGV
jgi:Predicted periplasmic protein (DUF2092)